MADLRILGPDRRYTWSWSALSLDGTDPGASGGDDLARERLGGPPVAYTLAGAVASVAVSVPTAALKWGRRLSGDATSVAAASNATGLAYGRVLAGAAGTAVVTGVTALTLYLRVLAAAAGAWTASGLNAALLQGRRIAADASAAVVSAYDATLSVLGGGPTEAERTKRFMLMGVRK